MRNTNLLNTNGNNKVRKDNGRCRASEVNVSTPDASVIDIIENLR